MKSRFAVAGMAAVLGCSRSRMPMEASGTGVLEAAETRPSSSSKATANAIPTANANANASASATPTPTATATAPPTANVAPEGMIFVPAGVFTMGADRGGQEDEHPAHQVTLGAYWLDKTEVTNEAYERCVAAKVCQQHDTRSALVNRFGGDEAFRAPLQPISSISWEDARAYCAWMGKRLPSEAEWEKAARGTDGRRFPWGNEPPDPSRAVYATGKTAEVGTHPRGAGPYGHLDMAGNVWEWLEDLYDPYAYRRPGADHGSPGSCEEITAAQDELRRNGLQGYTGTNPIPTECERCLRGGAFNYDGPGLRSSNRVHHPSRFRLIMSGVRCAKDG